MGSKVFQKPSYYHYDAPSSAFAPQGQDWDRPIGQVREMARRFRVFCFTLLVVALCLLLECAVQLNKKVPDILIAEQVGHGYVERVVLLPYDEERYLQFCPEELSGGRCIKNGK